MEIIIQSFADLNKELTNDLRWQDTIHVIINNLDTHIYTVWYWSGFEEQHEYYCVSQHMKEIQIVVVKNTHNKALHPTIYKLVALWFRRGSTLPQCA